MGLKIGLYNLEPKIINVAMMKVSAYHKSLGDSVEIYQEEKSYDTVYAFSIFDFTKKDEVKPFMICGGTGFDVYSRLPDEIEKCNYDWSLYPDCDFSIIWFSMGCNLRHPYCVVWKKDGNCHSVVPKNLNPNGKIIRIMDDNFFQNPNWEYSIEQLKQWGMPTDFQGIDVRSTTNIQWEKLSSLKRIKSIKISWDNPKENVLPHIKRMIKYIKPYKITCYILIGYWSNHKENLHRVYEVAKLGINPYAMPFDKSSKYQRDFCRYVNAPNIFQRGKTKWEDYIPRKLPKVEE